MPEPPRRKRFQIHLSTAIVLMFVAGVLIWANVQKSHCELDGTMQLRVAFETLNTDEYGWPLGAIERSYSIIRTNEKDFLFATPVHYVFRKTYVVINGVIALLIHIVAFLLLENVIRRRASRKGPP